MSLDAIKEVVQDTIGKLNYKNILAAVVVLAFFLIVGKLLGKLIRRAMNRTKLDEQMKRVILSVLRTLYGIVTAMAVLSELGFDTKGLIAVVSIISLGLALAAKDMLADVAGGIVMVSTKPFWVGDYIACDNVEGVVEEVHLNHTKLRSMQGLIITVPNRILASSKVKNYSKYGKRRLEIKANTSYDVPAEKTLKVLNELMRSFDAVLQDPSPLVYLTDYRESDLEYTMYCWVKTKDYLKTNWEMKQKILEVFKENDIEITYNHLNIHVIEPENPADKNEQEPTETKDNN